MQNQPPQQYGSVWSKDDQILNFFLENIKEAQIHTIQKNYPIVLSLLNSSYNIIFQQMVNLYEDFGEDSKEIGEIKEFENAFRGIEMDIKKGLNWDNSPNLNYREEQNQIKENIVLTSIDEMTALIWKGMNYADLFLQKHKKRIPRDAIRQAE